MTSQGMLFEAVEELTVAHAYAVLRGEDVANGLKPTPRQIELLRLIADRRGARRAVSAADLAKRIGCGDREIRGDVNDLRMLFKVKIGSARGEQPGYYLITNTEELFDTVRPFLSQVTAEMRLVRALCAPHELRELAGQMNLNLNDLQPKEQPNAV